MTSVLQIKVNSAYCEEEEGGGGEILERRAKWLKREKLWRLRCKNWKGKKIRRSRMEKSWIKRGKKRKCRRKAEEEKI